MKKYNIFIVENDGIKCDRMYNTNVYNDINTAHSIMNKWTQEDIKLKNKFEVREIE